MILITYSNNETFEFPSVSIAEISTQILKDCDITPLGIQCDDALDFNRLQDYIAGIQQSINLRR
jgi:hypothetical protein